MSGSFHRRLWVLLISAAAAGGVWTTVPGTDLDRAAFTAVASGFANPPLVVAGQGTHAAPWQLRAFSPDSKPDAALAPAVVSLGDDTAGFFQASPPAPIDLAVIFSNFQRLGVKKAASAAVLAWETPDPIGLAAVEKSLDRFASLVMAAPLSRGPVSSPLPSAFRRASVALTAIHGDSSLLPVVNRIPIPGVVLGGETALAGFSVLESEAPARLLPLVARWDDRVVFAFPLLTVLQRLNLPVDGIELRLGEYLKLGPAGPVVAIDEYGRLAVPLKPLPARAEISAEALIDGGKELLPQPVPAPLVLRDDRSAVEPATRAFSRTLAASIAAIASDEGLARPQTYPRLATVWEAGILAFAVAALTLLAGASDFVRCLSALLLGGICLAAQWIAVGSTLGWLPGIPLLAAIAAALVIGSLIGGKTPLNS